MPTYPFATDTQVERYSGFLSVHGESGRRRASRWCVRGVGEVYTCEGTQSCCWKGRKEPLETALRATPARIGIQQGADVTRGGCIREAVFDVFHSIWHNLAVVHMVGLWGYILTTPPRWGTPPIGAGGELMCANTFTLLGKRASDPRQRRPA
jgi:hypothetical protein